MLKLSRVTVSRTKRRNDFITARMVPEAVATKRLPGDTVAAAHGIEAILPGCGRKATFLQREPDV